MIIGPLEVILNLVQENMQINFGDKIYNNKLKNLIHLSIDKLINFYGKILLKKCEQNATSFKK